MGDCELIASDAEGDVNLGCDSDEDILKSGDSNHMDESIVPPENFAEFEPGCSNRILSEYESLDYDPCVNSLYIDEQQKKGYTFVIMKDLSRWLVVMIIGAMTALVASFIDICIEVTSKYKYTTLRNHMERCFMDGCLVMPYFLWGALSIGPTAIAAFFGSIVEPVAAGSGIPQVKCYLNGVKIPRIVRIKTIFAKVIGVIFSVVGGLAVGKEGPMIHSGAVIAAGMSQGKTTTFKRDFKIFNYFREDHEKRDFVSAGAAAGVAAAFGAPVGGVLFSLEEGASFWNQSLTWRVFFCAMVSTFILNVVLSAFKGDPGNLTIPGLLNLGKFDDLSYRLFEFVPFVLMGIIGGLLGALYNYINYKLTIFRMKYIHRPYWRVFESCVVAFVTMNVGFLMIYCVYDCRDIDTERGGFPLQMYCGEGQESTSASMWFDTPEKTVRKLFHDPTGSYGWEAMAIFTLTYFFLACVTYGIGVPSGLFIPTLLVGAGWGRMCGMFLGYLFPNQPWVDEGKYALVGAAAMLGGVVRMTLSLTVILMECVGNITFGLPLMIVLMVSKWVGDFFNEGLYDIHIQLFGAPIMPWDPPPLSETILTSEVMSRPVVTLKTVEKVSRIVRILRRCSHNGFPIVDSHRKDIVGASHPVQGFGKLRGIILRSQLTVLLKHKIFMENREILTGNKVNLGIFQDSYPRFYPIESVDLDLEDLECNIDLRPFMNPSPYSVSSSSSLPRMFQLFRALGLRHLMVIDDCNEVIGIVTRKDLVKFRIWKHRGRMGLEELVIQRRRRL